MDPASQEAELSVTPEALPREAAVTSRSLADLIWELRWQSGECRHTETMFTPCNVWRDLDFCPPALRADLPGQQVGTTLQYLFQPGDLLKAVDPGQYRELPLASFAQGRLQPRLGRFYPLGLLREFPRFREACRCVGLSPTSLTVDLNHPLAGRSVELSVTVQNIRRKKGETGGQCQEWISQLLDGPGQQSRWRGQPTDFFSADAFQRQDEEADEQFYAQPRLVSHLDRQARQTISDLYGRLVRPGGRLLDLMSSWQSHLPSTHGAVEVVGLGLNEAELRHNPQLSGYLVHDLNGAPRSVEYLTRPLEVFAEVQRLLRPDGLFILTFSNRWFPPKVIRIWTELLDFERLGLTLEYFLRSGGFTDLETFSARGWPRPTDDKYFPQVRLADPVYAVWGRKVA